MSLPRGIPSWRRPGQQIRVAVNSALEALNRNRDEGLKEMKHHIQEEIQANKERVVSQIKSKLDVAAESHGASLIDQLNETVRETGEQQEICCKLSSMTWWPAGWTRPRRMCSP